MRSTHKLKRIGWLMLTMFLLLGAVCSVQAKTDDRTVQMAEKKGKRMGAPRKVQGVELDNQEDYALTVSWKRTVGAEGYRVTLSEKASFSGSTEQQMLSGKDSLTCQFKGLTAHKTYFVRVEAYAQDAKGQFVWGLPSRKVGEKVRGILICIDPGHQEHSNERREANGPGSRVMKKKVSSGTEGVVTKYPEYKLNLEVSLMLRKELEKRGYQVIMTRTTHRVNLSNQERARIANKAEADLMIRVHANSNKSRRKQGILMLCITKKNPFCGKTLYRSSHKAADFFLKSLLRATKARSQGIWQTDTMTGLNWSEVPSIIVEMGYMSNPDEDRKLMSEKYRRKLVTGMADGADLYLAWAKKHAK